MNTFSHLKNDLQSHVKEQVYSDHDLTRYTTLYLPFTASLFVEITSIDSLVSAIRWCRNSNIPFIVIGGGSNIAWTTSHFDGLIIRNSFQGILKEQTHSDAIEFTIASGTMMSWIVQQTIEKGVAGFEYQLGLPGTLGGALHMNSKWMRPPSAPSDHLISAVLINSAGEVRIESHAYFQFAYDYSILQDTREICAEATFLLPHENKEILRERSREALAYRQSTQPSGHTSGCYFRNISHDLVKAHNFATSSAGSLIDKAGLKGKSVGGFTVSEKHANFLINTGNGTAEDLRHLIQLIRLEVKNKFGITLQPEVKEL